MNAPRSINSTKPFVSCARDYIANDWGVLPLPRRRKEYPPTGFTGRAGKFAEDEDLDRWLIDPQYSEGNIALRVGNMLVVNGVKYEVLGIDVDNHSGKPGVKDLARLEQKYGKLPDTWTSSSRDDGVSGIRFYLVPYGYGFRGKASDSIDIVQRVHRYAVVYPSWHPDTKTQYFWYKPGVRPEGKGFTFELPSATTLPVLPDGWIEYLTDGRQKDDDGYGIDLDCTPEELVRWRKKNFPPDIDGLPGGMCPVMVRAMERHIAKIEASPSNHDKLIAAHSHLIVLAAEGHSGLRAAIEKVEETWMKDVLAKRKRDPRKAKREMVRSFKGALRKLKAKADAFAHLGFQFFSSELCVMDGEFRSPPIISEDRPWIDRVPLIKQREDGSPIDPKDYDKNDVGMAQMFLDRVGDSVRYLSDIKVWILYDGTDWHMDDHAEVGALFHRACVKPCKRAGLEASKKFLLHIASGGTKDDAVGRPLKSTMDKLLWVAEHYGNDHKVNAMLNRLKGLRDVGMNMNEMNCRRNILALPGGKALQLANPGKPRPKNPGWRIIDNDKLNFTTMKTAVSVLEWQQIPSAEKKLWDDYLDLFIPDEHLRRDIQKVLGHTLFGGNPERKSVWLKGVSTTGKSTIVSAMKGAMAGYASSFQPNSVLKEQTGNTNPELGNLLFNRVIHSVELGGQRISSEVFKNVTGGDEISVTYKFANRQVKGVPHFTIVIATNNPPNIPDLDQATMNRILVLPFEIQVAKKDDNKLMDLTISEKARHAVLRWLVDGYKMYINEGIELETLHPKIQMATNEFANDTSDVAQFLNDLLEGAPEDVRHQLFSDQIPTIENEKLEHDWSKVTNNAVYEVYVEDCRKSERKPIAPNAFSRKVCSLFGVKTKPRKIDGKLSRFYVGLKWKNEAAMSMRAN